jgi:protein-serine/threonine kinase
VFGLLLARGGRQEVPFSKPKMEGTKKVALEKAEKSESHSDLSPLVRESKVGIDLFRKIRLIGKGDVGAVYLVQHRETKKFYAMKVLTKEDMLKRNKVKRVFVERKVLASVNHPFIVRLCWYVNLFYF